ATYCGGPWTQACARPLLALDVLRDVRGRLLSLNRAWAPPQLAADESWRGFIFDPMGRLGAAYEQPSPVPTAGYTTGSVTSDQVGVLGASATKFAYGRETAVGDLLSITAQQSSVRFVAGLHAPGHQLTSVTTPGLSGSATHDASGRLTSLDGAEF